MRVHACSVAFRHHPVSAPDLARYVARAGFDGIEIWAPHARALRDAWRALPRRPAVPMLSGYLPLGTPDFDPDGAAALIALAGDWGAGRLRLFAGGVGNAAASPTARAAIIADLARTADLAHAADLRVVIETHPQTLADGLDATRSLLAAMDHPAIGINFDVLHVWEAGDDPLRAFADLRRHVHHLHLKNVTSRAALNVFAPANIHDAQGHRSGICPLFDGAVDYDRILVSLPDDIDASLEWFGPHPGATMAADLGRLRRRATVPA